MNNYRFNEKRHIHQLFVDGYWKNLTGCTTILGILAKPYLIQWAANVACEYIMEKSEFLDLGHRSIPGPVIEEARFAHTRKKESAGTWGSVVHAGCEQWAKTGIVPSMVTVKGTTQPILDTHLSAIKHFQDWSKLNAVTFLDNERHIYSKTHWLGGIVDFIVTIGDQTWIGDIKTGSGISYEAFWQMAGYHLMLQDMGLYPNVTGYLVLNLKKDGTFAEKRSISNEDNQRGFLSCLEIYRLKEKLENQIIK